MRKSILTTLVAICMPLIAWAQFGTIASLHVDGNQLKDEHGNVVVLHGFMDTPSPYFNNWRWGNACNDNTVADCKTYFNRIFTAVTDTTQGAYCNLFRLHLDCCWTNDNSYNYAPAAAQPEGTGGEADIKHFNPTRLKKYLSSLYYPIAQSAMKHGMYVIMRPPGVCPGNLKVGDYYQQYLLQVWDIVSQNTSVKKAAGWLSIELANEPVNLTDANGQSSDKALHDYFQPIVDKIRENGFTGIIWVPGTGWQSNYRSYAKYPITGYNIGYAVHDYTGWYGCSDSHYDHDDLIRQFHEAVPVVDTNPIVITEIDWSPVDPTKEGHYNEHGEWVQPNMGTWSTGSTSKWGLAYKNLHDHFGNISMTLSGSHCYFDWDTYAKSNYKTVVPAYGGEPEACAKACFDWYAEWAKEKQPRPDYAKKWTSDSGNGYYVNPIVNADFPDCDVIRVDDTYYMLSTTMFHLPGATLLKSKDLVNWEYCCNPLEKIVDNDDYNLKNGKNHYSQGMWAGSLNYHNGKFYIYFPCSTWSHDSQSVLLTATNPEGEWQDTRLSKAYHDPGWLFDDGPNGDGGLYVACGIGDIYVAKLNPTTYQEISSTKVISVGNGCEGSHMYHIGDYYYIYATYGGTEGSQTIFRSKSPMGPYEEHDGRIFEGQKIHQGGLVETQTGEWWTILFRDAGSIGRIPYLEPVVWNDGWPTLGKNGRDVTENGTNYKKPNVGKSWPLTYLPTNETFTGMRFGKQWQWNHNPDNSAWSLSRGWIRLSTTGISSDLWQARNSLTQRIPGYAKANLSTASQSQYDTYGTVKMAIGGMAEGDVAGLAVFQDPYALIGVKMENGERRLYSARSEYTEHDWGANKDITYEAEEVLGDVVESDTIYLRTILNFATNKCRFYYSYDNQKWTAFGQQLTMRYTLKVFVGQRFYLFNYATKQNGGFVDIDWFSTEQDFSEEKFFAPGTLETLDPEDLMMASLKPSVTDITMGVGTTREIKVYAVGKSGYERDVTKEAPGKSNKPTIIEYADGVITAKKVGTAVVSFSFIDSYGTRKATRVNVTVTETDAVTDLKGEVRPLSVEYYTTDGRRLATPQRGVYFQRTRMSDGTIKTTKVLRH